MKEHNPDNPILHESINGPPISTPSQPKQPKKRDHDSMMGFQGEASASRSFPIPKPVLERDFQMSVQLNPRISVGPGIWGQRNWVSYISGHWNGRWGKGTVVVSLSSPTPLNTISKLRLALMRFAARWSRLPARSPRPLHPLRKQLPPPNPRSSTRLHRRQERRLARRSTRDSREAGKSFRSG